MYVLTTKKVVSIPSDLELCSIEMSKTQQLRLSEVQGNLVDFSKYYSTKLSPSPPQDIPG